MIYLFVLFQLMDILTTIFARSLGLQELNPIMAGIDFSNVLLAKMVFIICGALILYIMRNHKYAWVFWAAPILSLLVVIWNSASIIFVLLV